MVHIRRGKTLKQKALKKYDMDSEDAIANIVANGKNNMSATKMFERTADYRCICLCAVIEAETDWQQVWHSIIQK